MPFIGQPTAGGIDTLDTMTNSTEPSSGQKLVAAYLQSKGLPMNAENVRRALTANAQNPGLIPRLVNNAPSTDAEDYAAGATGPRSPGEGGPTTAQRAPSGGGLTIAQRAPSDGSVARVIEQRPQVSSDTAASGPQAPPRPQVGSDSSGARSPQLPLDQQTSTSTSNTSAQPTGPNDNGYDPSSLLGLLPSAAGIGAAALAARYGGGGGGEFVGNSGGMPSGRSMDVPPDPLLAGPRLPQIGGPPPEALTPEMNPLQSALARAIEPPLPMGAASGTPTTPQMSGPPTGVPQLPAPGPRAAIPMPDSTSGPTIAASDMRPVIPSAGLQPGPTSPTQVNRTAGPAANPNAIVNPPFDASRARNQLLEYLTSIARNIGGAARGRPMRMP